MNSLIACIVYFLIGYIGSKVFKYGGLLEICFWPIVIPLIIWIEGKKGE